MVFKAMKSRYSFESERLGFRLWKKCDIAPFAKLGRDVEGMRFFARAYSWSESYSKMCDHIVFLEEHGYGFWAVELKSARKFIGTIGFNYPSMHIFEGLQMGWCLDRKYWNQGLATEGALAALEYLKNNFDTESVHSYTTAGNSQSRRVMQKLGMDFAGDFELDNEVYVIYRKNMS